MQESVAALHAFDSMQRVCTSQLGRAPLSHNKSDYEETVRWVIQEVKQLHVANQASNGEGTRLHTELETLRDTHFELQERLNAEGRLEEQLERLKKDSHEERLNAEGRHEEQLQRLKSDTKEQEVMLKFELQQKLKDSVAKSLEIENLKAAASMSEKEMQKYRTKAQELGVQNSQLEDDVGALTEKLRLAKEREIITRNQNTQN